MWSRPRGYGAAVSAETLHHPVVVLDLDGTLVDSVYQHVVAWHAAFRDVGLRVSAVRIHEAIGMGGDRVVAHVAGDAAEAAVGDDVRKLHDDYFRSHLRTVCALDGAADLVEALAGHGHRLALASSSESDLVDDLLELLDVRRHLTDAEVELAVLAMTSEFASGKLLNGLQRGIAMLAEHARPQNTLHA